MSKSDFNVISAAELMDTHLLPRSSIVENFITSGTYILAGPPKIGKSFLMTQLCYCISEGQPFLGHKTMQSTVLYLALEDTQLRLQQRLNMMFGADWNGSELFFMFQTNLQGKSLISLLTEFVYVHPETRLIIIDTLQRARSDDNAAYSYAADYNDICPFKEFTDANDVALILVHHTRKNTDNPNVFNQISGTNGLLGAADGAFILHNDSEKDDGVRLDFSGRDLPSQNYSLKFDRKQCLWLLVGTGHEELPPKPEPLLDAIDQSIDVFWQGSPSEFFELLAQKGFDPGPKPNILSRRINLLTNRLRTEKGIIASSRRTCDSRILCLRRSNPDPIPDGDMTDDDDDAPLPP